MRPNLYRPLPALVLASLSAAAQPSPVHPCALLTAAEASAALGESVTPPSEWHTRYPTPELAQFGASGTEKYLISSCAFQGRSGPGRLVLIELRQLEAGTNSTWRPQTLWADWKRSRKKVAGSGFQNVKGAGTDAFLVPGEAFAYSPKRAGMLVRVLLTRPGGASPQVLSRLLRAATARLP